MRSRVRRSGRWSSPPRTGSTSSSCSAPRWSVHDDAVAHWVEPELEFLRAADRIDVPVLGLCFGAQMLAAAHGAAVLPGHRPEVGWLTVESRDVLIERGPWLQWHFDVFEVPLGAELLASSPAGPQAIRLRRNLGLQFHPEADRHVLEGWFADDLDQIVDLGMDPEALLTEADRERSAARERADRLVDAVLSM